MDRIIGSNSHGFANELEISNALNDKKISELNNHLRLFIKEIAESKDLVINNDTLLKSSVINNNKLKQDLVITIDNHNIYISVKMGSGNSVHQEKIEDFLKYLEDNFENVSEDLKNAFRLFIWADGSYNGKAISKINKNTGIIENRFGGKGFKEKYPKERAIIQEFVNNNVDSLITRFLFEGKHNSQVDYIYYGTAHNGIWISSNEIIEFNKINSESNKTINLGRMGIQAWNVNLKGTQASEKKRGQLQVKYGKLEQDLEELLLAKVANIGTTEGDRYEFDISKSLNKNKKSPFWKLLAKKLDDYDKDDVYVVKVTNKAFSKVSERYVSAKSDAYLIEASLSREDLFSYNFELAEDILKENEVEYSIIPNTGISIKRKESKSFTIVKMTKQTFIKYFEKYLVNPKIYFVGLLLFSTKENLYKNKKIIKDLNVNEHDLLRKFQVNNLDDQENIKKINATCKSMIYKIIEANKDLKLALFTGRGVYEDPYLINFMVRDGTLTDDPFYDYSITTGSGRSKGTYTIVLKPK